MEGHVKPMTHRAKRNLRSLFITRQTNEGLQSVWLDALSSAKDAEEEALSLLTDPRDTIIRVQLWDHFHEQFSPFVYRLEG